MASVRDHIKQDLHQAQAEHHVRMGKIHQSAMKKAAGMEDKCAEEYHKSAMAEHTAMAEHHLTCCKDLSASMKAAGMSDDALMPDYISSIAPEIPAHIRAVPRSGQREIDMSKVDIAPGLEEMLKIE